MQFTATSRIGPQALTNAGDATSFISQTKLYSNSKIYYSSFDLLSFFSL